MRKKMTVLKKMRDFFVQGAKNCMTLKNGCAFPLYHHPKLVKKEEKCDFFACGAKKYNF